MKTKNAFILFAVLFFLAFFPRVGASPHAGLFFDGIKAYHAGHYDEAASIFSRIAGEGVVNDKLYYNLGNAYYKKNDPGRAILWYERAFRLSPEDADLKYNLEFVRSQVKDLGEDKTNAIFKILFFWKYALSEAALRWIAVISNGLFWILLTVQVMRRKRTSRLFAGVAGTMVLILALTAGFGYYENRFMKKAVILSEKAVVRSGWSEDATELFVLHAGTRVEVEKEERGYFRIYFSKGKIGWVKKETAEII
ncbi:MAG: tetratricopeptide repeat protein [Desulfobacteraceae bacterium]|nr:tetratricopeptide repeat protein [Desulfobacteraceae bacterium]